MCLSRSQGECGKMCVMMHELVWSHVYECRDFTCGLIWYLILSTLLRGNSLVSVTCSTFHPVQLLNWDAMGLMGGRLYSFRNIDLQPPSTSASPVPLPSPLQESACSHRLSPAPPGFRHCHHPLLQSQHANCRRCCPLQLVRPGGAHSRRHLHLPRGTTVPCA